MANGLNVHMYSSPFTHETRMLRITRTLTAEGIFDRVLIVASLRKQGTLEHEKIDENRDVWRVRTSIKRLGFLSKVLNSFEWSLRAMWGLRGKKITCLNAHALSVLPIAVFVKWFKGCKLVYDTHEIETETTETIGLRKKLSRLTERFFVRFCDELAFTSQGHLEWYRREYGLENLWLIRNHPYKRVRPFPEESILKKRFGLRGDEILYLYQGSIAKPRGTDLLMDVFTRLPKHLHIAFMGFGEDLSRLLELEKQYPNIHYLPAVKPSEVADHTSGADAGIHMMDDSCVNHLHALPNKPLEYMNAGIPAIVSDLPEMGRLVRESRAGWVVGVNDGAALEKLLLSITRADLAAKAGFARQWAAENTWENEERTLRAMYARMGFLGNGARA